MLKKLFGILIPTLLIILAFKYNFQLGLGVLVIAAVYMIYEFLPDFYVYAARYNYGKNNAKMFELLEKAYKTGRLKADYKNYYAYMCLRENKLDKAEQLFNAVLSYKQPDDVKARCKLNYALLLWKKGENREALQMTEEVFEKYKSVVSYCNYGFLLIENGEFQKALEVNLEAYKYDSSNDIIADNLAQTYYMLGKYEESEKYYKEIEARAPKSPTPYYNYAKTLYALGKKEEAAEKLRRALEFPFTGIATVSVTDVEKMLAHVESEI